MKNLLRFACLLWAFILAPSVLAITINHPSIIGELTPAERAQRDALAKITGTTRTTAATGVPKASPVVAPLLSSLVNRHNSVGTIGILSGHNYAPTTIIGNPHVGTHRPTKTIPPSKNPSAPLSVPDGSSTVVLLGMALIATAILKRQLISEPTFFQTRSLIVINQNQ